MLLIQPTSNKSSDKTKVRSTVGIDMGQYNWVMGVLNRSTGKYRSYSFVGSGKEQICYSKIETYLNSAEEVHVCYEAGRYGFTPARVLHNLGAEVTVLPVNKIEVVQSGKKAKTDKLDARFQASLDPKFKRFLRCTFPQYPRNEIE